MTKAKSQLVLGIESPCDETSASVVKDGHEVLSSVLSSQMMTHTKYGGVVPEVAARMHIQNVSPVVQEALKVANVTIDQIDKIAVTVKPGLKPALLVGVGYAKGLATAHNKPLVEVNHLDGHVHSNFLYETPATNVVKKTEVEIPEFPLVTLLVSGGHTQLIYSQDHTNHKIVGETRDDAAGEAFDKVARVLGLEYPGGPAIDRIAREGFADAFNFPRSMMEQDNYEFSFSGLKTAVKYHFEKYEKDKELSNELSDELYQNFINDTAASFQEAVVDVLVTKTINLAQEFQVKNIAIAGGVAANSRLRDIMAREAQEVGLKLFFPELKYCVDNAAMIAGAGFYREPKTSI